MKHWTLIDLTHPMEDGQPCYPGDPPPRIRPHDTLRSAGYNTTHLALGSHQGTHLDAPYHYLADGLSVDRIPLERLYGPAAAVDLAPGGELAERTAIRVEDLAPHAGEFEPGARVILRTGWGRRFGTAAFFEGHPSLTPESAAWIAARGVWLLGLDTPSPAEDAGPVHHLLLGAGIVILESLANLDALPPRFTLAAFPLKLVGRDGSPVRAVALAGEPA
jgi:kynurenine formamidase